MFPTDVLSTGDGGIQKAETCFLSLSIMRLKLVVNFGQVSDYAICFPSITDLGSAINGCSGNSCYGSDY